MTAVVTQNPMGVEQPRRLRDRPLRVHRGIIQAADYRTALRTTDKKPSAKESRPARKKRAMEANQTSLKAKTMFTVQEAIALYEREEKLGFPLDLQLKRFAMES
jgi:hypothetical protein